MSTCPLENDFGHKIIIPAASDGESMAATAWDATKCIPHLSLIDLTSF